MLQRCRGPGAQHGVACPCADSAVAPSCALQVAGITPSLPAYFKPTFPAWLCPSVMPDPHRPLNPKASTFEPTGILSACTASC